MAAGGGLDSDETPPKYSVKHLSELNVRGDEWAEFYKFLQRRRTRGNGFAVLMFAGFSLAGSATADDLTGSEVSGFRLPLSHQCRRVAERVIEERRRLEHVHDDV